MKSIKFKMWINMMAVVAVLITVIWLLLIVFLQNFYEFAKEGEVKKTQRQYISILESSENIETAYDKIIELSRKTDNFVEIYDHDKNLIYSPFMYVSHNGLFGRRISANDAVTTYAMPSVIQSMEDNGQKSHTLKLQSPKNGDVATIVLINTVEKNGAKFYVASRSSLLPLQDTRLIFQRFYMIIILVLLITSLILSFFFAEFVTKPITRISHAAKQVAAGNYNIILPPTGHKDEMGMLTDDFNHMTKEIAKVDSIRKDLLANVSHELKTPLTMIRGYAETIKDLTGENKEKREKQLDIIIDESERLSDLITNVLDLSQLQANKIEFENQRFNLSNLIKGLMPRYDIFRDEGYEIETNISPEIYSSGDFARIEQVVCNLIDNAINHSDLSAPITVRLEKKDCAYFSVTNFGEVIDEENINHIWDRYYRIDKSGKRRITGTGIGLSIVKEILTAHGFEFGVTSTKDLGTTFWIEFPFA
ncbi:MAG: HAMP domain-containing histidine kinase [Clostridia bacterium]|nr:HAMP domain-containing histidine kinase [Clostridia bacterium]